jgi:hypothetical protein
VNPQRWNGYAYVGNNPLARTDVKGYWWYADHDKITRAAYAQAHIPYNNAVNIANQRTDTGGHAFYSPLALSGLSQQDNVPKYQRAHFLRSTGESQITAYNNGITSFERTAKQARNEMQSGQNADEKIGKGVHGVQDSFAHTTRNEAGEITHIQCYNCNGSDGTPKDHAHPDYEKNGVLTPQATRAIDASAAYLTLMQNAGQMTDKEFDKALKDFEQKYLKAEKTITGSRPGAGQ